MPSYKHLLFLCLVLFVFGCKSKTTTPESAEPAAPDVPMLNVPYPSDEAIQQLGKENDVPSRWFLTDPVYILAGQPKRFLESPLGKGNEALLTPLIGQLLKSPVNPLKIKRFVQVAALPAAAEVDIPQQDGTTVKQQQPIPRNSLLLYCTEPVNKDQLLAEIINLPKEELEKRKRGTGETEYYDLTPPNYALPHQTVIAFPTEDTVLFLDGQPADIQQVFGDNPVPPKSAAVERLKHLDLDTPDLSLVASLEGISVDPRIVQMILIQMGIPQGLVETAIPHLRALTASFNQTVETGQPMAAVRIDCIDEKGAKAVLESVQGIILMGQTTFAAMDDNAKQTLPIPPDFTQSLLNALSVKQTGAQVDIALNKFDGFDKIAADGIRNRQTTMQQIQFQQARGEQITAVGQIVMAYRQKNGKFPADIKSADGKPLLSWRVTLLPLMGLEELYKKFKLDEQWDSETNKPLMETMPTVFGPMREDVKPPKTIIRFFNSEGTPLHNPEIKLEDLKVPQSTLLLVSVTPEYAVEWTKPDALIFDVQKMPEIIGPKLFGLTFSGQIVPDLPLVPAEDKNYEPMKKTLEALVKGLPAQAPVE
ncbi:MAG: hypothetical protein LBN39_11830 [Planctomycetaceae bacterium]|jgi:hypothetical protein|nr:hypothetical protein [Planctomycetaceae bacterium]